MLCPDRMAPMASSSTIAGTGVSHTPWARLMPPMRSHSVVMARISDCMTPGAKAPGGWRRPKPSRNRRAFAKLRYGTRGSILFPSILQSDAVFPSQMTRAVPRSLFFLQHRRALLVGQNGRFEFPEGRCLAGRNFDVAHHVFAFIVQHFALG